MPGYYFTLGQSDTVARKPARLEYPNLTTALADAHRLARSLIRNRLRGQNPEPLHGSFDVEDDQHRPVARIPLPDLARQLF
jgi:hypothetical protein